VREPSLSAALKDASTSVLPGVGGNAVLGTEVGAAANRRIPVVPGVGEADIRCVEVGVASAVGAPVLPSVVGFDVAGVELGATRGKDGVWCDVRTGISTSKSSSSSCGSVSSGPSGTISATTYGLYAEGPAVAFTSIVDDGGIDWAVTVGKLASRGVGFDVFVVGADVTERKEEGIMLGPELGSWLATVLGTLLFELEGA
jgi:hypothetical protein